MNRPSPPPNRYRLELDEPIIDVLNRFVSTLESALMPTTQELVDQINNLKAEVTGLMTAEHDEVLAAIADAKKGDGTVAPEVAEAVQSFGQAVKDGVQKIFEAAGTPPTDGGTGTPVPAV